MRKEAKDIIERTKDELSFTTARSSGAGGQHVNKVETKVILRWDVKNSPSLNEEQRSRILDRLDNHINKDGILSTFDQSSRSQHRNKENAIRKWSRLINKAFYDPKKRKKSKPSKAALSKMRKARERKSAIKAGRQYKPSIHD